MQRISSGGHTANLCSKMPWYKLLWISGPVIAGAVPESASTGPEIQSSVRPSVAAAGALGYSDPGEPSDGVHDPAGRPHGTSLYGRYTPGVETTVPALILIIGIAVVLGRTRPVMLVAGLFLVIGCYAALGEYGPEIGSGIGQLADLIKWT